MLQHSRRCSSLVLRRAVSPQCLPFLLTKTDALKHFREWAKVHDSAKDVSTMVMGGWSQQDGVSVEAHAIPWWCFDVHDPHAWPTEQRQWVYAGIEHDAISLREALSEALDEVAGGAQPLDSLRAISNLGAEPIAVEDATLTARTAWDSTRAELPGGGAAEDVRALALVYMPAWRVRYTYLGVPLTAWTCARTGLTDGIHTRGLGQQFFDGWLPSQHAFWERAEPWVREFDRRAAESYQNDPQATAAAMSAAGKALGLGAGGVLRLGARIASRHPKVFLASLALPYIVSWARPVVETGWRAAQAQLRASRAAAPAEAHDDAAALDARADWEELLRRGEERLGRAPAAGERRRADVADKSRAVDVGDPRSVLGLPTGVRVSPRALEAAFRRELLAWHPDHAGREPSAQAEAAERTRQILQAYKAVRREAGLG